MTRTDPQRLAYSLFRRPDLTMRDRKRLMHKHHPDAALHFRMTRQLAAFIRTYAPVAPAFDIIAATAFTGPCESSGPLHDAHAGPCTYPSPKETFDPWA